MSCPKGARRRYCRSRGSSGGKSRLLAELADRADARDHLIFTGRAGEFESELPFVGPAGGRAAPIHAERYRTYRAVRALLEDLARRAPVVLVLDDVHWCDASSIELIAHLADHPPAGGVFLAVGFRRAQVDPQLAAVLATAARDGASQLIELTPLSYEQARQLLAGGPSHRVRDLYRESGGNPFYLEQLARVEPASRSPARRASDPSDGTVPEGVRAALAGELASLSLPARTLLEGASIVGDPFDVYLAARAAGQARHELGPVLDELAARELIREEVTPGSYRFRHPSSVAPSTTPADRVGAWSPTSGWRPRSRSGPAARRSAPTTSSGRPARAMRLRSHSSSPPDRPCPASPL